jgi:hypothetical protein
VWGLSGQGAGAVRERRTWARCNGLAGDAVAGSGRSMARACCVRSLPLSSLPLP